MLYLVSFLLLVATCCTAFTHPSFKTNHNRGFLIVGSQHDHTMPLSTLQMAGFGGGGSTKKGGKNKKKTKKDTPIVLKPKQQWDRYANLKAATGFKVAVRVVDGDDGNEWLETGKVKSENDESTEMAVALQRGIIAEHSKRLYPLKVLPKDRVEWGFSTSPTPEQEDWILVTKDAANDAPTGAEKSIGFEGKPDPASGFYCHYENGRLIDRYSGDIVAKE
mmetsp:Transcript_19972/g.29918  ORF Transcript_19972/g.29918 Transcript_19972/m.29918 type:complete len:220 (+) Transcript_19972:95-754(+)